MTEVDVALPEGVVEPPNKIASASSSPPAAAADTKQLSTNKLDKKQRDCDDDELLATKLLLEGRHHSNDSNNVGAGKAISNNDVFEAPSPKPQAMEVDGNDTEEGDGEDSQITSSSESGHKVERKLHDEDEEEVTTNGDHDEDDELDKIASTAENSCDGEDPLSAVVSVPDEEMMNTEDDDESSSAQKKPDNLDEDESQQSETIKTASDSDAAADEEMEEELSSQTAIKKETLNGFVAVPPAAINDDAAKAITEKPQKENGQVSLVEAKAANESGVVNLDDDSDEEEDLTMERPAEPADKSLAKSVDKSLAKINSPPDPAKSLQNDLKPPQAVSSGAESSDDAVLIASDSESEMVEAVAVPAVKAPAVVPSAATLVTPKPAPAPIVDDDDDDDCVVIEDDTPPSISPSDLNKRKAMANDLDDMQNPSKRQRSSTPSGIGQLTIKDARSLMPHEAPTMSMQRDVVYPVTITNAVTGAATNLGIGNMPPKLVPMSGIAVNMPQLNPPTLSLSGLPSMTNNANLLPGLTDDMFVLEAPSFIVPYIYEKPPNENIQNVIRAIETKYALSAEDLAVADKPDEFDMMTEQNKDKLADGQNAAASSVAGKKKKKRGDDESWSEQSDEDDDDDDDDDSESGVRTKVLIKEASDDLTALKGAIKPAAVLAQSGAANTTTKPGQENYFESPLGKFFMDIGVGLVQEYVQADLLRLQKRKMRKSLTRDPKDFEMAINALSGNLQASKTKNAPFKFTMKRCEFCNFKSESALSMANHYETPHMNGGLYKCNFCTFEIRNATEIVYHMEAVHNIKARLIKPLPYHQCPNCGFEDNGKAKLARHQPVCAKKFRPELNLAPPNDWEAPAKIPRIKPRHGLVGTATAYQAMAAQAAAQKAALATIQQQQAAAAQARNLQAAALAAQNAAKMRARAPPLPKPMPTGNTLVRSPAPVRNAVPNAGLTLQTNYQLAAGQLVQQASKKPIAGQPSISITPLPRQSTVNSGAAASSSKMPQSAVGMKPGQSPSGNNKAQFVICEICDGYIKDLEQLRNHMQWMHKVKIHPKMIYNRPPLNCQKCQFRFFTDQGLERHLLGSHGLVTSSMQEAANKGKDAGRCPVCGRMYQWKLLNHVSRDHHMTLKPAHLSYKCTVCTATFGMYKQFETHVYTAHSTVAKKAMDSKKNSAQAGGSSSMSGGGLSRNSLGVANDSLLKPLKINDEITIIPQPASKPRITNMESHVID